MSNTITVIVASKNPLKVNAVKAGFEKVFNNKIIKMQGISVESNVPEQPIGDNQTFQGAKNRALNAKNIILNADFYVGIEGGIKNNTRGTEVFAWIYIIDHADRNGVGKSGSFYLPHSITNLIDSGLELSDASDIIFNEINTGQNNGTIGLLTNNVISREDVLIETVIYALIPFINERVYFNQTDAEKNNTSMAGLL